MDFFKDDLPAFHMPGTQENQDVVANRSKQRVAITGNH